MFVDSQNAIYIADSFNHRIVKWNDSAHQGYIVAGGNGKGNQTNQLNYPTAVFVDRQKNIYVADNENNRIQKWSVNGKNGKTIIGKFGRGSRLDQIDNCWSLYVDKNYNVYVAELSNHRITKWSPGAQSGQIVVETYAPIGVHVHEKTGDIYVASYAENSIKQFAADGSLIRQVGNDFINGPFGIITIANVSSENAYAFVADSEHRQMLQMQMSERNNKIIAGTNNLSKNKRNQFNKLKKVQFDSRGNLLVLDSNNHRVQTFPIEKNCDAAHPILHESQYYTSSTHIKHGTHLDIIQQPKDPKTSDADFSPKGKDSPIGDNFFPEPKFRDPRPMDTDVHGTLKDFSFDLPKGRLFPRPPVRGRGG
jgi:sugar lactone lactonase YvrE